MPQLHDTGTYNQIYCLFICIVCSQTQRYDKQRHVLTAERVLMHNYICSSAAQGYSAIQMRDFAVVDCLACHDRDIRAQC